MAKGADASVTQDDVVIRWQTHCSDASKMINREPSPGPMLERWVKDAGFVNVRHRVFKVPVNGWPKDPKLKLIGQWMVQNLVSNLDGFSMRLMCDVLKWKEEEVLVLLAGVRKQLKSPQWHAYFDW